MLLRGRRRPLVGRVSMDQVVVDLGDDPADLGEIATVFGPGDAGEPTVAEWAAWADTIEHEIVTGIGARVRRVVRVVTRTRVAVIGGGQNCEHDVSLASAAAVAAALDPAAYDVVRLTIEPDGGWRDATVSRRSRPAPSACSGAATSSSRRCTDRAARTAPWPRCASWPACRTSGPACAPARSRWTSGPPSWSPEPSASPPRPDSC